MKKVQNFYTLDEDNVLDRIIIKSKEGYIKNYQRGELLSAVGFCKRKRVAVDIGANCGIMSFNMSKIFDSISAFEIDPNMRECLERNVKELGLSNVKVHQCGLGNADKIVGTNIKRHKSFNTHVDEGGSGAVVKTLDSFNFDTLDFMKIDAEGYEPLIIQGAMETIERCKPVILYERIGLEVRYGYTQNSVLELLADLGYADLGFIDRKNGVIGIAECG